MATGGGTLYDRLLHDLEHSGKIKQEVASGRRIGFYRLKSQLGAGNFAQVKLGLHLLTNEKVAVKIIDKTRLDDTTTKLLSREISCMEKLCHQNLIKLFEVHESFSRLCLVMECAAEGNLQSRVEDNGAFPEPQAKEIFSQIAAGVAHMHTNGVTHRDLKPENVFYVSSTQVKIGDFGFSTPVTDEALSTFCGSPVFAAPELLQEKSYFGPPVDMWALGATLYYMVTGNVPFPGSSVLQVKEKVLTGNYLIPTKVGPICQQLVAKLLSMEPSERPSISDTLDDPWLHGVHTNSQEVHNNMLKGEADDGVVAQMKNLGVPVGDDTASLLAEPHTATTGTYRILLHQKLQQNADPSPPPPPTPPSQSKTDSRRKSSICNIL